MIVLDYFLHHHHFNVHFFKLFYFYYFKLMFMSDSSSKASEGWLRVLPVLLRWFVGSNPRSQHPVSVQDDVGGWPHWNRGWEWRVARYSNEDGRSGGTAEESERREDANETGTDSENFWIIHLSLFWFVSACKFVGLEISDYNLKRQWVGIML